MLSCNLPKYFSISHQDLKVLERKLTMHSARSVWPDLEKFCRFGEILSPWQILAYFAIRQSLHLLWQICYVRYRANFLFHGHCCKWPILNKHLTIWSHCSVSFFHSNKLFCSSFVQRKKEGFSKQLLYVWIIKLSGRCYKHRNNDVMYP